MGFNSGFKGLMHDVGKILKFYGKTGSIHIDHCILKCSG